MRKLFTILSFLIVTSAFGATFTLGSGSGTLQLTSMSGHSYGDSALCVPGTYSSATFSNIQGIKFFNNGGFVFITGGTTMGLDSGCLWNGGTWSGSQFGFVFENSITWSNRWVRDTMTGFEFSGVGTCLSISGNISVYDQINSYTKTMRGCVFNNLLENNSTQLFQGTFAAVTALQNVLDSISVSNLTITNDQGDGNQIQVNGIYHLHASYWTKVGGTATGTTDVGMIQIVGNAVVDHVYRNGGYGYIMRICSAGLNSTAVNSYLYDCIDVNTKKYGSLDCRSGEDFSGVSYSGVSGLIVADVFELNNTTGNKTDTAVSPYTAVLGVIGDMSPAEYHAHNNFCYNNKRYQSNALYQLNTSDAMDTSNNFYQPTASFSLQDSTITWMPLSNNGQLNGTGITQMFFTIDFNNRAWVPWGVGSVLLYVAGTINALIFKNQTYIK